MVSLKLLLARWELADLPPEDVPDLAVEALTAGCDASELALLATLDRPTRMDVEEQLPNPADRLRCASTVTPLGSKVVVDDLARQVVNGAADASGGARKLWRLANNFYDDRRLFGQLAIFVGLGSEWDDHPTERDAIEAQIVTEAQQFLERGGLDIA